MDIRKHFHVLICAMLIASSVSFKGSFNCARISSATCTTGVFVHGNSGKKYVPYTPIRQADVLWEKRIWRAIDLREKINQPFMYPLFPTNCRLSLIDVVKKGFAEGQIIPFRDDEFKFALSVGQALSGLIIEREVPQFDSTGDIIGTKKVSDTLSNEKITRIRLREDWFFDKQRSVVEVRILGIGFEWYDEDNAIYRPLFWLYYPQCRQLFSQFEFFNPGNDAEKRTYDEIFQKRMFNSLIEQESNTFERPISSYAKGLDALIESERIKNDLFKWEHDLWHF